MTNLQGDPNGEALIMAAVFASQGYIVVAPNYAGYDSSTLPYHPYLVADQQSKDMIDALTAARSALRPPPRRQPRTAAGCSLPGTRKAGLWRWRPIAPCRRPE